MPRTNKQTLYDMESKHFDESYEELKKAKKCLILKSENVTAIAGSPFDLISGACCVIANIYEDACNSGFKKEMDKLLREIPGIIKKSIK